MLKVMDMSTGKIIEDEFGSFEREVMYAEWQPSLPQLQLTLQSAVEATSAAIGIDVESFMRGIYQSQE